MVLSIGHTFEEPQHHSITGSGALMLTHFLLLMRMHFLLTILAQHPLTNGLKLIALQISRIILPGVER